MKYYEKLIELGCFSRKDLVMLTGSEAAASSLIYDYLRKGYIERVRHDLYTVMSLESKQPVPSRYQIGSNLFPDACITHHSAFEFYGYANQVFYEMYIGTKSRFLDFEYNGIWYHRIMPKPQRQVVTIGNIRVTSLEQTVVDSIQDFEKISGIEEVLRCILLIPSLNVENMLFALSSANNRFLYQKCGYLLEEVNTSLGLPESFFEECRKHKTRSRRYLFKENAEYVFNAKWGLYVPKTLLSFVDKGVANHVAV